MNITDDKDSFTLSLAAPGLKKEDYKIETEGNQLSISAEKKESKEGKSDNYCRQEYNYSSFSRSFTLPPDVDKDKIKAHCENGVLEVTIPKSETARKITARKIPIN